MMALGPLPGTSPREDAMRVLPEGTRCQRRGASPHPHFVILLPGVEQPYAMGRSAPQAWTRARKRWESREQVSSRA